MASFPRAALRELVQKLADTPAIWEGDAEPAMGRRAGRPASRIKLDVRGVRRLGTDEFRQTYNSTLQANRTTSGGHRVWSVSIRSESLDANAPGFDVLEDVSTRLRFSTTLAALAALGLALVRVGDVVPLDMAVDNRSVYAAVVEVTLSSANVLVVSDDEGGWIGTVNGSTNGEPMPGPEDP